MNYDLAVIIPVYNRANYFRKALSSLDSQNYKNFTTIVIDDCSTENIKEVCDEFKDRLHLVYIKTERNIGPARIREYGLNYIAVNHIDYFMFMDADDIYAPHAVQSLYMTMRRNPDMNLIIGSFKCLFKNFDPENADGSGRHIGLFAKLFKTELVLKYDIHFADLACLEDFVFNYKYHAVCEDKIYVIDDILYYYYSDHSTSCVHKLQETNLLKNTQEYNSIYALIDIINFIEHGNLPGTERLATEVFKMYNVYEQLIILYPDEIDIIENALNDLFKHEIIFESFKYLVHFLNNEQCLSSYFFINDQGFSGISYTEITQIKYYKHTFKEGMDKFKLNQDIDMSVIKSDNCYNIFLNEQKEKETIE